MTRTDDLGDEVEALAARHGGRVGLTPVLTDLDRRLRRSWAPGLAVRRAWAWDRHDQADRGWWPQGISVATGGRYLAVSWYATAGGSRVSFVDLRRRRYGHVLLVLPTSEGHEPLRVHAGGLAWTDRHLYVAATGKGLWVCRLDDVVRTDGGYVLPARHRLSPSEDFRFSFVSPDAGSRLLAGEYGGARQTHRLLSFSADGGPAELAEHGVVRAQGIVRTGDGLHLTASHGPWGLGSLWSGPAGSLRERRFALPMGVEDLAYDASRDRLWTVTEHPWRRWLVTARLSLHSPIVGVASVTRRVRWQGVRREGIPGVFRAAATQPACPDGGAQQARIGERRLS
ncbi:hypothetical protein PZ894_10385 [Nocardioides sp. YIM 152315]|nr:hypothetical protein [Nocardioides sp. YIM 152315]